MRDAGVGVRWGVRCVFWGAIRHATSLRKPRGRLCPSADTSGGHSGVGGQNRLVRHVGTGVRAIPISGANGKLPSRRGVGD